MNARQKARVLKLANKIIEEPEHFDMSYWFQVGDNDEGTWHTPSLDEYDEIDINACGTTACIAGWAVLMFEDLRGMHLGYQICDALALPTWAVYRQDWPFHYQYMAQEVGEALAASALLKDIAANVVIIDDDEVKRFAYDTRGIPE